MAAPLGAPQVERVGDREAGREQAEHVVAVAAVGADSIVSAWFCEAPKPACTVGNRVARWARALNWATSQPRRRGPDVGIGDERALDQVVERPRLEHAPPLAGNVEALHDLLRLAAGNAGRHELVRLSSAR